MKNGVLECKVCGSKDSARQVSVAYDHHQHSKKAQGFRARNVLLVVGDCLLIGAQPILVYMSKVDGKFLFSPVSVNFLTEVVKVFFAICMLLWQVCAFVRALMCFILLFYDWVHHICSEG
jgi:hypothetical protein